MPSAVVTLKIRISSNGTDQGQSNTLCSFNLSAKQPTVLFSHTNQHQPPVTNQSAVLFSQNKSALGIAKRTHRWSDRCRKIFQIVLRLRVYYIHVLLNCILLPVSGPVRTNHKLCLAYYTVVLHHVDLHSTITGQQIYNAALGYI